jgi:hypothetical protein
MDTVKIKSLTTPDDRLPGAKEVPILWNRGSACTSAVSTLTWNEADKGLRKALLSNAYFRYFRFIQRLVACGIPVHTEKSIGGWGLEHYEGNNLQRVPNYYKGALKVLFRNDQSLAALLDTESLASVWAPRSYSKLGRESERLIRAIWTLVDQRGQVTSLASLQDTGEIPEGEGLTSIDYLDKVKFNKVIKSLEGRYRTFRDAHKYLGGRVRSSLLWLIEEDFKSFSPPSLKMVGLTLKKKCLEIISRDPSMIKKAVPLDPKNLTQRAFWRTQMVLIKIEDLDCAIGEILEGFMWDLKYASFWEAG